MGNNRTAAIIGASGYSGAELLRLIAHHPEIEIAFVTADSQVGRDVGEIHPHLAVHYRGLITRQLEAAAREISSCDVVFVALPHGESCKAYSLLRDSRLIVDLGGDFRLKDLQLYERWYGCSHAATENLSEWCYGLPEIFRAELSRTKRVANPGCYATAIILAAAPLLAKQLVKPQLTAIGLSGTSGAGKGLKENLHFSHADENIYAYRVTDHQHTPEIEQALSVVYGGEVLVSFTPHVVPMTRGIYATLTVELEPGADAEAIQQAYQEQYQREPFVRLCAQPPMLKQVRGSNAAALHISTDIRLGRAVVTCAIDNLVKGAAGQALQNANLCLGLPETLGLPQLGFYP
ncbi:MAG: N-acetyl-gamma-glutamyl-phosphate reductase [Proteobacteria bacterium]|nr:MAG: N-acetyl-gamma-glutamyl-phosphate reductase [Pseudomonadota bacterium]